MLRRLRWKFILIIMLLLTAVLATVLSVQTSSAIAQFRGETDRVLQAALQRSEAILDLPSASSWTGTAAAACWRYGSTPRWRRKP